MTSFGVVQFVFSLLGFIVTTWWVWLPLGAAMSFFAWQNYRKTHFALKTDYQLLEIEILKPHKSDATPSAETLFNALHSILRPTREIIRDGSLQEHVSFEIASINGHVHFYVWTPKHLQSFVESQIYAYYPGLQINEVESDYTARNLPYTVIETSEFTLAKQDILPLKISSELTNDPMNSLLEVMQSIDSTSEELWLQIMARPANNSWHKRSEKAAARGKKGKQTPTSRFLSVALKIRQLSTVLVRAPQPTSNSKVETPNVPAIESKRTAVGFETKIRMIYAGNSESSATTQRAAIADFLDQYTHPNGNELTISSTKKSESSFYEYRARYFMKKGFILNAKELGALWHVPAKRTLSSRVTNGETITTDMPSIIPTLANTSSNTLSMFGSAQLHGTQVQFGLQRSDRAEGVVLVGHESDTAQSQLLLALSDIYHNQGLFVSDLSGGLAKHMLSYIPAERSEQVVYLDATDTHKPIGFNPLNVTDPTQKQTIITELMAAFSTTIKPWDTRTDYIVRYALKALLDYPKATLASLSTLLTNASFRTTVLGYVSDASVRSFWSVEFNSWDQATQREATHHIIQAIEQSTQNRFLKHVYAQPVTTFNFDQLVANRGIFIANIPASLLGKDSGLLLQKLLVARLRVAASHAPEATSPFFTYYSGGHATPSTSDDTPIVPTVIPKLCETIALPQLNMYSETSLNDLVKSNASIVLFRTSDLPDALNARLNPVFSIETVQNLAHKEFIASLHVNTLQKPFKAHLLTAPDPENDISSDIIEKSQHAFGRPAMNMTEHAPRAEQIANIDIAPQVHEMLAAFKSDSNSDQESKNARNNNQMNDEQGRSHFQEDEIIHLRK